MTPVDLIISTVPSGDTFWVTHFCRAQSAVAQPWQRSCQILFSWRIEVLSCIYKILSPGNNQDGPVNSEIQYLESKYPSSIDGINLRMEMRSLQGLKKAMPRISTKDFMGVLVASYSSLVPQCSKIATLYLIAPIQNAVVESVFFPPENLIITSEDSVFSSKQSGERSSSNTAPTCSLRIS